MNYVEVTYRFVRDERAGFFSSNRPSTDAIGLLLNWQAQLPTRQYEVIEDTDESIVATLRTTQADVDANQGDMDARCNRHGVSRTVVDAPSPGLNNN